MAGDVYLADTTVYVLQRRHDPVRQRVQELLTQGRLAVCQMTALEYLDNAPDPDGYETPGVRCMVSAGSMSAPAR